MQRLRVGHPIAAHQLAVDATGKLVLGGPHVGPPAGHARAEVAAGPAEHHDQPAGHVLAAVVAHALDDSGRATVAHREALARLSRGPEPSARGAVEDGVPDQDALRGPVTRIRGGAHDDFAAAESLAHVVVGLAGKRQAHTLDREGAEALARTPGEVEPDRAAWQAAIIPTLGYRTGQGGADRPVDVGDGEI